MEDSGWEPTTILRGPLGADDGALKSSSGSDIVATEFRSGIVLLRYRVA